MASLSVVMRQPVGVHMQGSAGLRVGGVAASSTRELVSLPTTLGGQVNLSMRYSGVGQGIPRRRRNVGVIESRAVTDKAVTDGTVSDGAVTERQAQQVKKAVARRVVVSPNLAKKWREVAGATDWEGMLNPLDADLRKEIIRYGEFAQASYDCFDNDEFSKYRGSCRYNKNSILQQAGLEDSGYEVTKFLYTTTNVESLILINDTEDAWSRDSNWMGFVAVCTDEERIKQLGRRDIVVAWRGTVELTEWAANLKFHLIPSSLDDREMGDGVLHPSVGMEQGFLSLYTSNNPKLLYNKKSAREQLLSELNRLIEKYDDEMLSITTTGHSLGAALALLSAYDIAESGINRHHNSPAVPKKWNHKTAEPTPSSSPADSSAYDAVPITVMSFAGPRVGNTPFVKRVAELGVKVLRVVNVNDFVPKVPGFIFGRINLKLDLLDKLIEQLPWTYSHAGVELQLNNDHSPHLKPMPINNNPVAALGNRHNLEMYLHLVAGYQGRGIGNGKDFKLQVRRDMTLVNKASDALAQHKNIPSAWFQLANKGLVLDENYDWVQLARNTEDIPTPDDLDDE